jgi:hypothetical protein
MGHAAAERDCRLPDDAGKQYKGGADHRFVDGKGQERGSLWSLRASVCTLATCTAADRSIARLAAITPCGIGNARHA